MGVDVVANTGVFGVGTGSLRHNRRTRPARNRAGFTTKVLSVGMLRKQGFKMSLDTEPYGFYTPSKEWVPVGT